MKVVINRCFGGYGLSYAAMLRYCEIKDIEVWPVEGKYEDSWTYWLVPEDERVGPDDDFYKWPLEQRQEYNEKYGLQTIDHYKIDRTDPALVQTVEELGQDAWGRFAELKVVEIPDDIRWEIAEYDGCEHVAEQHRTWS